MICIGEGEETFSELYDEINNGSKDFEKINGLCLREKNNFKFTAHCRKTYSKSPLPVQDMPVIP